MDYKYTTRIANTNDDYLRKNSYNPTLLFDRLYFPHSQMI